MTQPGEKQFPNLLEKLGFTNTSKGHAWEWADDKSTQHENKKGGNPISTPAWRVDAFSLAEKKNHLSIVQLDMLLDRLQFKRNLETTAKSHMGSKTSCEVLAADDGDVHVLFEFVRPGSRENSKGYRRSSGREMPCGIGGYRLRFVSEGSRITAVLSNIFGFGFVPGSFVAAMHRHIADALGLRSSALKFLQYRSESLFELSFHVADVAVSSIASRRKIAPANLGEFHEALTKPGLKAKDARRHALQTICVPEESSWRLRSGDHHQNVMGRHSMIGFVPIEVLESRERRRDHAGMDELFLQGKFDKAAEEVEERIHVQPQSLYLARRWCLLSLLGRIGGKTDVISFALASEPTNPLFLSSKVNSCLMEDNMTGVLENLSRLGEILMRKIPMAEKARCFDVVLPELLGDAWCEENHLRAIDCYQRIIQKRGDLPRILRKLIGVTRDAEMLREEERFLDRLATVERRRVELSRIHCRLAELRMNQPGLMEQAIDDALLAVEYDRTQVEAALLAKDLLVRQHRPEEAIQLLDGLLRDTGLELSGRGKARLEAHIAGIWMRELKRPDLAEGRYRQALAFDPENIDALRDLEVVHRQSGDTEGLVGVLERQFTALERDRDLQNLRIILRTLVDLYRNSVGRPADALDLYRRALDSIPIAPEDIDQLLKWNDEQIDWRSFYAKLNAKVEAIPSKVERGQYLCRLAEICRTKLADTASSLRHYLDALKQNVIDANGFHYLVNHLSLEKDYGNLALCYELRLAQIPESQQVDLIMEYLNVPQVLGDQKRDELALRAYRLRPEDPTALQQRLTYYQSMDDVAGIGRLVQRILSDENWSRFQKASWIQRAIHSLAECIDPQRFALMDQLYRESFDYSDDRDQVLIEAVRELAASQDPAILVRYIGELLESGIIPDLDERFIRSMLASHEKLQAEFEMLRSQREEEPVNAASYARTAAALYRQMARPKEEEAALARVAALVLISEEELAQLRELASRSGNFEMLAKAYESQVDLNYDVKRSYELLSELGELYRNQLNRPDRAIDVYRRTIEVAPRPEAVKWHIAGLAKEAGDQESEISALTAYIADPDAEIENIEIGINRLLAIGGSLEPVRDSVIQRIHAAMAQNNSDFALRYLDVVMEQNIGNPELYRVALEFALQNGHDDRVKQMWWRGLTVVSNKSDAHAYISETAALFYQAQKPALLLACYREGLIRKISQRVPSRAYVEYLVQYGLLLFDNEAQRKKATVVMREVHDIDPQETRVWMPLYFLLTDYGMPAQRLEHLDSIVPQLIQNPKPLRSFPLTLESLKAEREELQAQLSGAPRKTSDFDLTDVTGLNRLPLTGQFGQESSSSPAQKMEPAAMPVQQVAGEPHYGDADATQMVDSNSVMELNLTAEARHSLDLGHIEPAHAEVAPITELNLAMESAAVDMPAMDPGALEPAMSIEEMTPAEETPASPPEKSSMFGGGVDENGEVSMVVDLGELSQVYDLDLQADGQPAAMTSLDLGAAPGTEQFDSTATMLDVDVSGVNVQDDLSTSFVPSALEPVSQESGTPDASEVSVPDGLPPLNHQAGEGSEIIELDAAPAEADDDDGIPKPRVPQLYGNLFDEDEEDVAQVQEAEVLPQSEDAEGTGQFQLSMNEHEREMTGNASSVELAAALGMDEEAEEVEEVPATALVDSAHNTAAPTSATSSSRVSTIDWRNALDPSNINPKLTRKLLNQAFANEVEKHIALQAIAVMAGNCEELNNWHWRVWRKPDEFGYQVRGKERFPESQQREILQSSTAKLVLATAPIFVKLYKRRFTTEYLSRKLKIPVDAVVKNRQPFSWREEPMSRCGFVHYADRIKKRGYKLFDLPGLQKKIFYEIQHRTLYLDRRYYNSMPPSHLFHRVLNILWAVRMQYFVPLTLNPKNDAYPIMAELAEHFNSKGMTAIRSRLRGRSNVIKALDGLNIEKIKDLYGRVGVPRVEVLNQLWFAMQTQIYLVNLAETLDLLGLLEAIVNRDLLEPGVMQPGEIIRISPYPQHLIDFVTKLEV